MDDLNQVFAAEFGKALHALETKGLSLSGAAKVLGVTKSALSTYCHGKSGARRTDHHRKSVHVHTLASDPLIPGITGKLFDPERILGVS